MTAFVCPFYEQNLPGLSITSLDNLLEIEAANGQAVPYLGYVEVRVTFPEDFLGSDIEVITLALVITETGGTAQLKVLIGTNTLDLAYEKYLETNHSVCQAVPFGYRAVIRTIEHKRQQKVNSGIGIVRLPDLTPTVVPAVQNVVLEGVVSVRGQVADKWAVMEPPSYSPFTGGLLVVSCLLNLPQHPSRKVPVVLKNETEHDIMIPGKSVIADIHALQKVISHKVTKSDRPVSNVRSESAEEICFDFGDSFVPEVWKERISQKLHAMKSLRCMIWMLDTQTKCNIVSSCTMKPLSSIKQDRTIPTILKLSADIWRNCLKPVLFVNQNHLSLLLSLW